MGGIGIVNNPRSRRNRRWPGTARRLAALLGDDGEIVDASTPAELSRAVERLRAARIDLLAVNGGDGTGHQVLTAWCRASPGAPLPSLLLLRGGSTNAVATGNGVRGRPERILREALARLRRGEPIPAAERDLLRVRADGGEPLHGFLFGTGAMVAFLEAHGSARLHSAAGAAWLLARAAASALAGGRLAASLVRRDRLQVSTDGDEWPDASYLALAAGSTPHVGFGFPAFHRCAEQPGFFHAVGITGSLARLALSLPLVRRGAPWRRSLAQDEVARSLRLQAEEDGIRFTLDGDLYGPARSVSVETGPPVRIAVP